MSSQCSRLHGYWLQDVNVHLVNAVLLIIETSLNRVYMVPGSVLHLCFDTSVFFDNLKVNPIGVRLDFVLILRYSLTI